MSPSLSASNDRLSASPKPRYAKKRTTIQPITVLIPWQLNVATRCKRVSPTTNHRHKNQVPCLSYHRRAILHIPTPLLQPHIPRPSLNRFFPLSLQVRHRRVRIVDLLHLNGQHEAPRKEGSAKPLLQTTYIPDILPRMADMAWTENCRYPLARGKGLRRG